jgi:hypothetical protein
MTGSGPLADLLVTEGLLSVERCDALLRAAGDEPPLPGMMARLADDRLAFDTLSQLGTSAAALVLNPAGSPETPLRAAARAIVGAFGYQAEDKDALALMAAPVLVPRYAAQQPVLLRKGDPFGDDFILRVRRLREELAGQEMQVKVRPPVPRIRMRHSGSITAEAHPAAAVAPAREPKARRRVRPAGAPAPLRPLPLGGGGASVIPGREISARWPSDLLKDADERHAAVLEALRQRLAGAGLVPMESDHIDLACKVGAAEALIFEAKSVTPENEFIQATKAFTQLRLYRHLYRGEPMFHGRDVRLWVVLSAAPVDFLITEFLRAEGIRLVWVEGNGFSGPEARLLPGAAAEMECASAERAAPWKKGRDEQ